MTAPRMLPSSTRLSSPSRAPSVLDDVLAPGLSIVFCGSAVGAASARRGAYYAGPGNQFWPVLFRVGLTDRQFAPQDYRGVTRYGLGLTDINKTQSGADRQLSKDACDAAALREKILSYAPRFLAFNGKKAAAGFFGRAGTQLAYGRQEATLGPTEIFVLPSTSGAARGFWDEGLWRALARAAA